MIAEIDTVKNTYTSIRPPATHDRADHNEINREINSDKQGTDPMLFI
jgi:hypothetical protein